MVGYIGLDFETYGAVNLPQHGLARYVGDKSFTPLIASLAMSGTSVGGVELFTIDFTADWRSAAMHLEDQLADYIIVAHNAPFEDAVLRWMGLEYPAERFLDSAMVALACGASNHLEAAGPQLLAIDKMPAGKELIKLFSIPGKYQEENDSPMFDNRVIMDNPQLWSQFIAYCELDSKLGLEIAESYGHHLSPREQAYAGITLEMNRLGWPVDIELVEEMQRRYLENQEQALYGFRARNGADELNLNSLKQMKEWCAERGVKATSFDEKHVERLLKRIVAKLMDGSLNAGKTQNYGEVKDLLETKQILGGSSLKKLQTILDTAVETPAFGGWRLRDQYLHCGAGQSLRTTGRGVQMQNLKKLGEVPDDVTEMLIDEGSIETEWDNETMARNLRQVFTASGEGGRLIVGDLSSVESRGLAYLAGEDWKVRAYKEGQKIYELQAARMYGIPYESITKSSPERAAGKVGELSCGYQAGAGAVRDFAAKMGLEFTEAEAAKIVWDWRDANPKIVQLWEILDIMLRNIVENGSTFEQQVLDCGMLLRLEQIPTPRSLYDMHKSAKSFELKLLKDDGGLILRRTFHGAYMRGRDVNYYKPSDRKTGDLWRRTYTNPKTKQEEYHKLYGGKLAGILTQSFCRELFFDCLVRVKQFAETYSSQVSIVGQFHDEIVLDWKPGALWVTTAQLSLKQIMSTSALVPAFPMAAEVKYDYRYTK